MSDFKVPRTLSDEELKYMEANTNRAAWSFIAVVAWSGLILWVVL